jgi:hypothetical protein
MNRKGNNRFGFRHDGFTLVACRKKDCAARRDDNG